MIVSIYAPQELSQKKSLWEYITHIIDLWDGECIILGDFNEVRSEHERFGTIFNDSGAKAFNHFISMLGLIDLYLEGYSYTWAIKSASKISKLGRFLVFEGLLMVYLSLSALFLDMYLSNHRHIIMREAVVDYEPSSFYVYHCWFAKDGFDKFVADSWNNLNFVNSRKTTLLRKKFQALKALIKAWCRDDKQHFSEYYLSIKSWISDLVNERTSLLKDLHNINMCHSLDMAQKVKIRPNGSNINLDINMFKQLSPKQNADIECHVSYDEIKRAVWDCDYMPSLEEPEQAPPSPDYIPGPEHADDEIVAEDQPYAEDASPIAQSPEYEESSEDEEDDEMDVEADEEEEEEEHPAPADSVVVSPLTADQAPSAEETEPFETDESAATPPPHPAYRTITRISIPASVPMPAWTDSEVARLLAISSPPASPLSPWSSPPPQIPFPPLPPILSPPSPILAPAPPPSPIRSLGYRTAMIRLRDEAASTSHSPPLQLPSASRREDRPEVTLPPRD
nr:RNA-directed DNA polymerase, eukaryota [Tanacetum cinerariifolium]